MRATILTILVVLALFATGFAIYRVGLWIKDEREKARDALSVGVLAQARLALRNYEIEHGSLPPLYIRGADGDLAHSWRLLIVVEFLPENYPELDSAEVLMRFDLSQPWNSPHNLAAARSIPPTESDYFRTGPASDAPQRHTNVFAFVGPGGLWDGKTGAPRSALSSDPDAILLVSVPGTDTHWAEPRDMTLDAIKARVRNGDAVCFVTAARSAGRVTIQDGEVAYVAPK